MRWIFCLLIPMALTLSAMTCPVVADPEPAFSRQPAAAEMEPGLLDDISEPFFEDDAFPLERLIAFNPGAPLVTYRGRCLSLRVFGTDLTARCERRYAEQVAGDGSVTHWFGLGQEAVGLGVVPPFTPPQDGVFRYFIGSVYRVQQGKMISEPAMGACRRDLYYLRCHAIGKSGRADVEFALADSAQTQQYPVADAFFRYKNAKVLTAPGQCVGYHDPFQDMTPFCASFVSRTLVDGKASITIFALNGVTFGFYSPAGGTTPGENGGLVMQLTYVILNKGDRLGTAPAKGTCQENPGPNGRVNVDCKATYVREGTTVEVSFETSGPWRETKPLGWQKTGGAANMKCEACPWSLPTSGRAPD